MAEPTDVGGPLWWVKKLGDELRGRQTDFDLYRELVDDEHMPASTAERSAKYAEMAGLSTTNLCGLVVEATAERMEVEGFRFGDEPEADEDAWRIWQSSDFDAYSVEQITHALVYGRSFISVDPSGKEPKLLPEDPRQVVMAYSSDGRRDRLAALKVFVDEWTGERFATLYLPDRIYRYQAESKVATAPWIPRAMPLGEESVTRNPLGEVPFFELRNRPLGRTRSEIANCVIPQQRLNQAVFNTDAVAEYGAFRQKWVTGVEVPTDPVTGQKVSPFDAHVAKIFYGTPPRNSTIEPRFGNFDATELGGYLELGREISAHIARISRVPITYFVTSVSNLSADALALMVSGLVRKCQRRVKGYESAFEGALRLAFKAMGEDDKADEIMIETRWASMETRSVAQDADAAVKLTSGDDPVITPQTAQEKYLGMSQTERDRDQSWRSERQATGELLRALVGPSGGSQPPSNGQQAPPAPEPGQALVTG